MNLHLHGGAALFFSPAFLRLFLYFSYTFLILFLGFKREEKEKKRQEKEKKRQEKEKKRKRKAKKEKELPPPRVFKTAVPLGG